MSSASTPAPPGDGVLIGLAEPRPGSHQLLIRRNRTTGELAYYCRWSPGSGAPGHTGPCTT
ncbi:hypothetical protein ACWEQ1_27065 [Streptomyces nodosus]